MTTFDKNVRLQDDFFGYINNNWLKNNPIPDNEARWGTFNVLRDNVSDLINKIITEINNLPEKKLTNDQKLLKTFFSAASKYSDFKENHLIAIRSELKKIEQIKDKDEIAKYMGDAHRYGICSFWSCFVAVDDMNSQNQIMRLHQGGLSLPNRDYYLEKNDIMKNIRTEYKKYFIKLNNIFTDIRPINWDSVFDIELRLAKYSWTDVKLRDTNKNYTKFKLAEMKLKFPDFNWVEYFKAQGWEKPDDNIVVGQPSFINAVLKIIEEKSLNNIKDYLSWQVINSLSKYIDESTASIRFDFYGKVINGLKEMLPLWKRIIQQSDNLIIGETLGKEYASRYFPESSKKSVLRIVDDVKSAYHNRIDKITWMGKTTKKRAHKKLDNIKVLIGYPSIWQNLDKLKLSNANHLENILSCLAFYNDIEIAKIGKRPPAEDWQMNAHTVNAYFDPSQLDICFPAGILQPPFFDPKASCATNLGGIGSVIGHELTHGFDDQGSEFDENGNMKKWQTNTEKKTFKNMTKNIIEQADRYEVMPGIFLKGSLVIGEILADIGGIELAIEALKDKNINNIKELLICFARVECGAERDEYIIQQAKIDPHPISKFRVNCTIMHIDNFYDVLGIKLNDKLYLPPEKRAHIW